MDMSAGMVQWLKVQGFHALRALEAARFPRDAGTFVAVGEGKTSAQALMNSYMGMDAELTEYYGCLMQTQLKLEVYTAREKGAAACDEQTALLVAALCRRDAPFACTEVSAEPVRYDDAVRCFCRSVTVSYTQWLCTEEE